jgi:hypothetical protein
MAVNTRFRHKNKQNPSPPDSEGIIISDVFTFEHRSPTGELLTTNKALKPKNHIKEWLKRLLRIA